VAGFQADPGAEVGEVEVAAEAVAAVGFRPGAAVSGEVERWELVAYESQRISRATTP
jgi:hypothetical protein